MDGPNYADFIFFGASIPSFDDHDSFEEMFLLLLQLQNLVIESTHIERVPQHTSTLRGNDFIHEILFGHPGTCYELFRMKRDTFNSLCTTLRGGYLADSRLLRVEESLAIFCLITGHRQGMRVAADRFQHSTETISHHFKMVMRALCHLGQTIIRPTHHDGVHPYIAANPKYYPWFEQCIGAIDGTHVSAWVLMASQSAFRGSKAYISQNVIAACDFDTLFTFLYTGWEGTTNDSCVFYDAVTRSENQFPIPPDGFYYLVDSGFPCSKGYLPPYRVERYYLQQFRNSGDPIGFKEPFNYRHSSLRMVIERCFGVLKARFHVLTRMPKYKVARQPILVNACVTLHNYIRLANRDNAFFAHAPPIEPLDGDGLEYGHAFDFSEASSIAMANIRDTIAQLMWDSIPHP